MSGGAAPDTGSRRSRRDPQILLAGAFCAVGWLSSFSYPLELLGPYLHDCADGDTMPYVASMVLGPTTLLLSAVMLAIGAGLGVRVRWPCSLHLVTLVVAVAVLPGYLVDTSVDGQFLCAGNRQGGPTDHPVAAWQRAYAPLHNASLVAFGAFLLWYLRWRPTGAGERRAPRRVRPS